jgi:riboflavin synthase
MFTGIISHCGTVVGIDEGKGRRSFRIQTKLPLQDTLIGASIACDGCCLTVVSIEDDCFIVDAVAETLAVTTLAQWKVGQSINLEKSLRVGDELGGHIVTGHVDALAVVESVVADGESWRYRLNVPGGVSNYIVQKGSVTLNGISLTVNEVDGNSFGVCIIPHTWNITNISDWAPGHHVNLEIDMMARYAAKIFSKAS